MRMVLDLLDKLLLVSDMGRGTGYPMEAWDMHEDDPRSLGGEDRPVTGRSQVTCRTQTRELRVQHALCGYGATTANSDARDLALQLTTAAVETEATGPTKREKLILNSNRI